MTLLGAVRDKSDLWIAADARHAGTHPPDDEWNVTIQKLFPLDDHLVWGWYGNSDGQQLEDRLEGARFLTWDKARDRIREQCKEIRDSDYGTLGVLIAGYIGGEAGIEHIGRQTDALRADEAIFCGMNKMSAKVGWNTACSLAPNAPVDERFDTVMKSVIDVSNGALMEPRSLWHITPARREKVR